MPKPSSVSAAMASQSQELRQQVNSEPPMKPAVIIGKIALKPRKEVVIQKKAPPTEPRAERPKQMKRADDNRAQIAGNQQMLQELQFVKKQVRDAEAKAASAITAATMLSLEAKSLLMVIIQAKLLDIVESLAFKDLATRVGMKLETSPSAS